MNKLLIALDQNLIDTQADLDRLKFDPALNPGVDLNHLIDDYHNHSAQRLFLQDRITAMQAIRPLLVDAIEKDRLAQLESARAAQQAEDAARIKELMAELVTLEPGPEQSLLLAEISKLRGEI